MQRELNFLIIEDVSADVVLINHELRKGGLSFRSKRVASRSEFIRELHQETPDLILSDHGLPEFDGFTALSIARKICPGVPFIFVTGSMGEEVAIESLKGGATDYVLKGRLIGLVPAVTRALHLSEERNKRLSAEHALNISEEQLRMLVEGVRDYAMFMLDTDGRVATWNSGAEWILGYQAAEIIGRHFSCLFLPEDIERSRPQEMLKLAATEGRCERESRRVRKGGTRFWASTLVSALRNAGKQLRGYAVIMRDVTERRNLEEVPARLAAIIQWSDDAIISKTLDGIITSWNPGAERLFGYTAAEAIGQPMLMLIPPERAGEEPQILARLARGETVSAFETVRIRRDGSRLDIAACISPIKNADGEIVGASNIARDITESKRAQEMLHRSEARHTAMLEAAIDAIISVDHQGVIHEWNTAAERIFGYPRAAALGRKVDELIIPAALLQIYHDGLANYLITGAGSLIGRPIELTAHRADGTEFAVELGITRIPASDPPLYTAVVRDITVRKQNEAEIRRLNVELEKRVQLRTAELETANQELESFSYSVSHDLRAPLRHIAGFAEMLQTQSAATLGEPGRRLLRSITESTVRMSRLIDALLDFSKLGRAELRKTRLSLVPLVRGVRQELAEEARDRRVEWVVGDLPEVAGDPVLLRQVLVNLFSNALKYTRPRDPARIEFGARTEPGRVVCFVRDNGVGFDRRYADKLFGVFQRLHKSAQFEGTGIGLANVRLIVQRHGGRVWAESGGDEGGATFFFSLPAGGDSSHG